ncbi:MAG: TonB-dependent receptor [Acidobacteriota bacterium]|nr:TonB-dependent receptor [Acidobacteriota bacterium]
MASLRLLAAVLVGFRVLAAQGTADIRGSILDARSGQPMAANVRVIGSEYQVVSDPSGRFVLHLDRGDYKLEISAPNYETASTNFHVAGDSADLAIALMPQASRRRDSVSVRSYILSPAEAAGEPFALGHTDMKSLATVLADDPFRAIQALPGVTSNDDFQARFSLRGADFSRIGIYLDGIQLHNAVHSLEGTDLSGSASTFNPELVEEMVLHAGAFPERFGDSSAGAVEVHMRDPDEDRYSLKLIANLGSAGIVASGPLGKLNRCSWTGGFRKSYLQYLLAHTLTDPSMAFGIEDGEGRVACRISEANRVSVEIIDSYTDLNRSSVRDQLGANALMLAAQHSTTANGGWMYSPNDRLLVESHVAILRDSFDDANARRNPVGKGQYQEWVANSTATWMWNAHDSFSAGVSTRHIGTSGFQNTFNTFQDVRLVERYRGEGLLSGGFWDESWTGWKDRIHLLASGRWDHHSVDSVSAFSPQASIALDLTASMRLQFGWGQYAQFPEMSQFGSNLGKRGLLPTRTNQATVALEQRLGQSTRVRVELYDRQDRDLLYQPFLDPRIANGTLFIPPRNPLYTNSLRGHGRGMEFLVQRSLSKGITGWLSYAYGHTQMHDGLSGDSFPSDWDQRHTINGYASYQMRPSVTLSGRWIYGSGFPAPGFFSVSGPVQNEAFSLSDEKNRVRIGPYQRLDLRVNKTWDKDKWKKTLYVEVTNLTNKANYRFGSLDGYARSGIAYVSVDQMFPILPSVGVVFQR